MRKINKLLLVAKDSKYLSILLRYMVAASVEHSHMLDNLNSMPIKSIIDIGANRGQFALVARRHFPESRIFSFEPLKEPAEVFRSIFTYDQLTTLHELAIGPIETESIIHVSQADDASSLFPISDLQNELFPGTSEKETRSITKKPLDAILSPLDIQAPAFLKIDVQGYEKQVLEGCNSLLPLFSFVYVECSFLELYKGQALAHQIIRWLDQRSFVLSGIHNLDYDKNGKTVQGDFLFVRTENRNYAN